MLVQSSRLTDGRMVGHFLIKELLYYKKVYFFRLICVTTTACQGAVVSSMDTLYVPVLLVILVLGNITFGHTVYSCPDNYTGAR